MIRARSDVVFILRFPMTSMESVMMIQKSSSFVLEQTEMQLYLYERKDLTPPLQTLSEIYARTNTGWGNTRAYQFSDFKPFLMTNDGKYVAADFRGPIELMPAAPVAPAAVPASVGGRAKKRVSKAKASSK